MSLIVVALFYVNHPPLRHFFFYYRYLIMFSALTIKMMTCRFAVLDCGIVTPFRYINWLHLYEYSIRMAKFFLEHEDGYDTIRAHFPRLSSTKPIRQNLNFC